MRTRMTKHRTACSSLLMTLLLSTIAIATAATTSMFSFFLFLPVSVSTAFVHHQSAETRRTNGILLPPQTQLRTTARRAAPLLTLSRPLVRSSPSLLYSTRDQNNDTASRIRKNKEEENASNQETDNQQEADSIPEIRTLRETIQQYSRLRSREGPKNAAHALRQLFKYYPPVPIPTTAHHKRSDDDSTHSPQIEEGEDNRSRHQPQQPPPKTPTTIEEDKRTSYYGRRGDQYRAPMVDVIDCTRVIHAYNKSRSKQARQQVKKIYQQMQTAYVQTQNPCIRPNCFTYTSMIDTYAKCGDYNSAMTIFKLQLDDYQQQGNLEAKPTLVTFNTMIDACSKSRSKLKKNEKDAVDMAEQFLATVQDWYARNELDTPGDVYTYSGVINCWNKSQRPDAPHRALAILQAMLDNYHQYTTTTSTTNPEENHANNTTTTTTHRPIRPNTVIYSSVINIFAQHGDIEGAQRVFTMMKEDYERYQNLSAKPNIRTYNMMINAWSKASDTIHPEAAIVAEALLFELQSLSTMKFIKEGPTTVTYNAVINCWSKSSVPEAPQRALNILTTMLNEYNTHKQQDDDGNNTDDDGGGNTRNKQNPSYNGRTETVRPDTITYNSVMNTYGKKGDIEGTLSIFNMMRGDFSSGNTQAKPDVRSYNILIDAYAKSASEHHTTPDDAPHQAETVLINMIQLHRRGQLEDGPDLFSYSGVINCWSKSPQKEAPDRAMAILTLVTEKYQLQKNENSRLRPNTIVYNSVMDAYARQSNIAGCNKVFAMMQQHTEVQPDVFTYNIRLDAWANARTIHTPVEAEKIFQQIQQCCETGELPEGINPIIYSTMIKCLLGYRGTETRIEELKILMRKKRAETTNNRNKKYTIP